MQIGYLGHAGFVVETEGAVVVADPWVSRHGAFASAWMQLPQNHHLAPLVRRKLEDPRKPRFVYVSHEHGDHFDREFLASVGCRASGGPRWSSACAPPDAPSSPAPTARRSPSRAGTCGSSSRTAA